MSFSRERILEEIQRLAQANDGRSPGKQAFATATGIKESDWAGRHWTKWSDALRDAGLSPNELNSRIPDEEILQKLAIFVSDLGHFPVNTEFRLKSTQDKSFPSPNVFGRFGKKNGIIERLIEYCNTKGGLDHVIDICRNYQSNEPMDNNDGLIPETASATGYVYLMKSGRYYKIGRSKDTGRRAAELRIQLPEKLQLIHELETDDPPGIENYWHRRFEGKRQNGEWFALTPEDVRAFKRRKTFM